MRKILSLLLAAFAAASLQAQPAWVQIQHPQAPSVPEYVAFAGDTVRFDRTDFYERMDRELISFTYMHTNTTLMLKRSRRYFAQIVPILRQQGIPEDLKYLMAIESSLDPKALSVAGAAGLWQFTKATAQTYGLEVSTEVDERYNIEKETVAACK
ncbi:MAG: transglycosylase SLT domain-containing protein, partial [Bacteroidales bacterium]|nr:transglycosylase SLT domain-containing protein [Bacteroidales bacterium]